MGKQENVIDLHDKLLQYLEQLETHLNKIMASSMNCMQLYTDNMQRSFEKITSYLNQTSLVELHQVVMNESMSQVCDYFKSIRVDYLFNKIYQFMINYA